MNLENLPTTPTDQDKLPPFMRPEVDQGPANMTLEQQFDAARAEERASAQSHEEKGGGMIMEVSTKVVKRLVQLPIFWASLLGFSYSLVASRSATHPLSLFILSPRSRSKYELVICMQRHTFMETIIKSVDKCCSVQVKPKPIWSDHLEYGLNDGCPTKHYCTFTSCIALASQPSTWQWV